MQHTVDERILPGAGSRPQKTFIGARERQMLARISRHLNVACALSGVVLPNDPNPACWCGISAFIGSQMVRIRKYPLVNRASCIWLMMPNHTGL